MKCRRIAWLIILVLCAAVNAGGVESVEWTSRHTFKLQETPIDSAVSGDGRWIFILTDGGSLLVYSQDGEPADTLSIGTHIDNIRAGEKENTLFLISRKNKTVEEIVLEFVYDIDVTGSAYKGHEGAPVVIAVFDDYQ